MRIKKYIDSLTVEETPFNEQTNETIITKIQNEQFDQVEINTLTNVRNVLSMFDRFMLDNEEYFQWYVSSSSKKLDNPNKTLLDNRIYQHNILLTEVTEKLKNYQVSNLSFNNFLNQNFTLLENEVTNGDFAAGQSNWNKENSELFFVDENGLNSGLSGPTSDTVEVSNNLDAKKPLIVDNKVYIYSRVRAEDAISVKVFLHFADDTRIQVFSSPGAGANDIMISKNVTIPNNKSYIGLKLVYQHTYATPADAAGKILTIFGNLGVFFISQTNADVENFTVNKMFDFVSDGYFEDKKKFFDFTNLFQNEFEVVERVRLLTPFEQDFNINKTRVWFGTETTSPNTFTSDPIWKQKGYTEKLYNLLTSKTDVKEIETADRNLYEFLQDRFIELGGTPRLIATDYSDSVLDIFLFNEEVADVTIDDFIDYRETKNINNYANNAEIVTNNIINVDSPYYSGVSAARVLQTEDFVFDEELAEANLELPIYNMIEVSVSPIEASDYTDLTRYFVDSEAWATFNVDRGDSENLTTQNTIPYTRGSSVIKDFGKQTVKEGIIRQTNTRWANMFNDAGVTTSGLGNDLQNYKFRFKYDALLINNRFNVKQYNFNQDNKKSNLRINTGEKVNEYDKIVRLAQNRLSRLGARTVEKVVKHKTLEDVYELNSFDTDSELYIVASETRITKGDIETKYLLTEDLNILTENVGVNSQLRFTDVQIGSAFNRNETYEDYVIFGDVDDLQDIDNSSSLTARGINVYKDLFNTNQINQTYSYLVGTGNYLVEDNNGDEQNVIVDQFLANPIISAGNRTLSFRLPLESQTFVDYEITATDIEGTSRLVERGVNYTDEFGLLDTLALKYGTNLADATDENTVRSYPRKEFFETDGLVTNDDNPYWEIGKASTTTSENLVNLDSNNKTDTVSGLGSRTITLDTSYNITDNVLSRVEFDWLCDSNLEFNPSEAIVKIYYTNRYGQEIFLDSKQYGEFGGERSDEVFNGNPISENFNLKNVFATDLRIEITYKFGINLNGVTYNIDLDNVKLYETVVTTESENFGLKVIKTPNEILNIEYMNHLHVVKSNYILGESLTFKNQFLNLETDQSDSSVFAGWNSIEIWSYSGRYNNYDTTVKGTNTGLDISVIDVFGTDLKTDLIDVTGFDIQLVDGENHVTLTETFAIVGVFNDERFLLVARNNLNGEAIGRIRVLFKHFHPLEVINY